MSRTRNGTFYVVAYDVASDKRRTKVHKTLSAFGHWTQYSLFECWLTEREYLRLRRSLDRILEESLDSVRFYPICAACEKKAETIGSPPPKEPDLFVV